MRGAGQPNKASEEAESVLETPFDGLLKNLADHFAPELLPFLSGVVGLVSCEPVGGEVELVHRLTDRVWKVEEVRDSQRLTSLLHLEFESAYDAHMGRRLGVYGWGLFAKSGLPVRHIVWYVGEKKPARWSRGDWFRDVTYVMALGDDELASVKWREVWLPGGFEAHAFVREAPAYLLPFAALMDGMELQLLGDIQDAILTTDISQDKKQELLVMLVFFACRSLKVSQVMEVIDMSVLKANPFAQYLIEQGLEQGLEQGVRKVALKMLAQGYSAEEIQGLTELSSEEIEALRKVVLAVPDAPKGESS